MTIVSEKKSKVLLAACRILHNYGFDQKTVSVFCQNYPDEVLIGCFEKEETVFSANMYRKALAVVTDGLLSSRKKVNGGDLSLRELRKGDIFGIAALFGEIETYVSEIVAKEYSVVVFFSEWFLLLLFGEHPEASVAYIKLLSKKIRYLNAKIDRFASPNAYSKLFYFLLENRGYSGSMTKLADILGVSRMTLYRALDELVEEGRAQKIKNRIFLTNSDIPSLFSNKDDIL